MYLKDIILKVNTLKAKTFKDIILKDIKWYKNIPDISKDITLKVITLIELMYLMDIVVKVITQGYF